MTEFRGAWTDDDVGDFLQRTTVPLRLSTHRPDGSLRTVALWYRYRDGAFECATGADADIVRFLRNDDGVAFEVSTNDPPYRGVRGNGTASLARDEDKAALRDLIEPTSAGQTPRWPRGCSTTTGRRSASGRRRSTAGTTRNGWAKPETSSTAELRERRVLGRVLRHKRRGRSQRRPPAVKFARGELPS